MKQILYKALFISSRVRVFRAYGHNSYYGNNVAEIIKDAIIFAYTNPKSVKCVRDLS